MAIFPDQHRVNHFGLLLLDGDGILLFSLVKVNDGDKKGEHPIPTPIPLELRSWPVLALVEGKLIFSRSFSQWALFDVSSNAYFIFRPSKGEIQSLVTFWERYESWQVAK